MSPMSRLLAVGLLLLLRCCSVSRAAVTLTSLTGSVQYDINTIADQNTWTITPTNPSATQIIVVFTALTMRQGEVRIRETSTSTILFNCASCDPTLPPPIYSKTGSITIFSTAITGVGFRPSSFSLQFYGIPIGATNQLNNTYATLNMGAASIVPFVSNGVLPASTTQQWAIRTNTQIVFSFSNFNFPDDCSATIQIHNRLTGISSSSLIFTGCRASDAPSAWFYSSTGVALVVVTTIAQDSALWFQLNYFSDMTLYACGSFVQPALTTDTSMIIADGSKSTELMQPGQSCTWQVIPSTSTPLSLILNRVSLKSGSSVTVYDGSTSGTSRQVLWNAVGATETVPPVITSTGTALYIQYASDSSNAFRYRGFQGDYYPNYIGSIGSGKGYTQLKMSSALGITPPGDGATHTPGVRYIWYVSPAGSTGPITFAVQLLRLLQPGSTLTLLEGVTGNTGGDTGGVAQDYTVGSRTVLATYSGDQIPDAWVRTSGTSATLIFQSSNTTATPNENVKIAYYSDGPNYHCGFTTNPASLDLQSFILTDGSSSIEKVYPNQLCQWKIQPRKGYAIVLVFSRFHLFSGTLRIYSGSALASDKLFVEIGETAAPPAPIVITDSALSLQYSTGKDASGYGFSMTYYAVSDSRSFPGDNVVTLRSSSVVALTLPLDAQSSLAAGTNLTWLIAPSGASGRIYFAISLLNLAADCDKSYLDIYDGTDAAAPLLARYCGRDLPQPYSWLQTSAGAAKVEFKTDASVGNTGNFELAYFADGPNFHCGFAVNPARMTAPSMVFSDGSGSASPLYPDQLCEWIIEPNALVNSASASSGTVIVVEFMLCDLTGAKIEIYDGSSDSADSLLWSCDGCSNNPGPLISSSNTVFVRFTSYSEATFGQGFQLMYWTASAASLSRTTSSASASHLLHLPSDFSLTTGALNTSAAFFLGTTTTPASLFFSPFYGVADGGTIDISTSVNDGRASPSVFEIPASQEFVCGEVRNAGNNRLVDGTLTYTTTQRLGSFLTSSAGSKSLTALRGVDRDSHKDYDTQRAESYFSVPTVCKYRLDSGSLQAVSIEITNFRPQLNGHLRVYGGLDSQDALLFDSNFPELYLRWPSRYLSREVDGVWLQSVNVTAPCGQATVVVETNGTILSADTVDYSLHFVYYAVASDSGQKCSAYFASLQPSEKKDDPTVTILVVMGAFGGAGLVFAIFYYTHKLKATQGYLFYPYGLRPTAPKKKIIKAVAAHPRYSPQWDQYLNRFLRKGECCVCKNSSFVVLRLRCGHALCLEDMKGFLETALGDISMFPLKCPMHFQGCGGLIDARIAKRVLTEPQYNRFTEFSDRAAYGDGMRCIFCYNYVNFPESMEHVSRVVCPYCTQNFCVRCKKAWHGGISCAVDTYDPSLEVWKTSSGAQKCPACKKLIEKDDPDTCNHMVHKITDGIPCIRDRTDFCYCCGEEVAPDYPHNEISGVNHFPDGVFQRCRRILLKEKEAERERLRKARRMKTKIVPIGRSSGAAAGGTDSPVLSPLMNPGASFSAGSPGAAGSMEAMWLLEQQYDIESSPFGSPNRPIPRTTSTTPAMSPSPTRVYPITGGMDSGMDSPAGTHTTMRPSPTTSARASSAVGSARVVPASGVYTTTIPNGIAAGGSSRSATSSPVRTFPNLEQQMMYQQNTMMSTRGGGASVLHGSASTPQLLLGSPQQPRTRFTPSGSGRNTNG